MKGIFAALITGESSDNKVKRGIHAGMYDIVFFTPELLISRETCSLVRLIVNN